MTEQELLTIAEERPENLLLVETGLLFSFVHDKYNAPDLRELALAELVAKWCLSGNKELASEFAVIMGDVWWCFSDWFNINRQWTSERFRPESISGWKDIDEFPGLGTVLRRRLDRLFDADGFIPVCNGSRAWFIPFQLEKSLKGAAWADRTEVTTWREPVSRALLGTDYRGIRIQLQQGREVSVTSESLMLPVRMAALRGRHPGTVAGHRRGRDRHRQGNRQDHRQGKQGLLPSGGGTATAGESGKGGGKAGLEAGDLLCRAGTAHGGQ